MLASLLLSAGLLLAPQGPWEEKVPSSGRADPRLTSFDALMTDFLRENEIPGAALAVCRDGRLIYSRGFGYASVEPVEPMRPDAIFRIASLSKPITSATLLLLAQEERLDLDDPVLLHLDTALLNGRMPRDPRWADVTIRQLLQHRAGFDRDLSGDPMFNARRIARTLGTRGPADAPLVIRYMLGRRLDHDPGTHYAYSNFGYCLLGRVIERVTGEDYETAVTRLLLEPLEIDSMRVGGSLVRERGEGEVTYYTGHEHSRRALGTGEHHTAAAYGKWDQRSLDAIGGWVASAPDLMRFLHLFDGAPELRLLEEATLDEMLAPPPGTQAGSDERRRWYGLGWMIFRRDQGDPNMWHNGSLPGSETLLVRRGDGLAWAVLFNARFDREGKSLVNQIDPLLHRAAREVRVWPDFDLFEQTETR